MENLKLRLKALIKKGQNFEIDQFTKEELIIYIEKIIIKNQELIDKEIIDRKTEKSNLNIKITEIHSIDSKSLELSLQNKLLEKFKIEIQNQK